MRIATISVTESILTQIQTLSSRQSQLQNQIATGQKIFQPEDDPSAVGRILTLDTESREIQQFQANAVRALELSQATYAGLQEIKKISDRAGEIATLGAGTASPDSYKAYAKEVNQLIEQTLQLSNSRLRNDYLFAGTAVDAAPFTAVRNAAGEVTEVTYVGNAAQTNVQLSELSSLSPGSTGATNMGLANTAAGLADPAQDRGFINHLIALRDALESGSNATVVASQLDLSTSEDLLVNALSQQGAIQLRIEINQSQQATRSQNLEKLISGEADADIATSVVKLSQTSTAYEAALASATKIMQMSLLDYLQ